MDEVDFSDIEAAEAWFETQTPQVRSLITSRAALRVLGGIGRYDASDFEKVALASFWAVSISAVRGAGRTADMDGEAATRSTLSANSAATRSANSAARSAAFSARSATAAAYDVYDAIQRDKTCLEASEPMGPLWPPDNVPPEILENHQRFLAILDQDPDWAFWRNWYLAMWDGTFEDWDLAHEVAKIETEVWTAEDALAQVAARIRVIEAEFASKTQPDKTISAGDATQTLTELSRTEMQSHSQSLPSWNN